MIKNNRMRLRQITENVSSSGWYNLSEIIKYKIDPDAFHGSRNAVSFIYTKDRELLWSDDSYDTHQDLVLHYASHFGIDTSLDIDTITDASEYVRDNLEEHSLTGRVSPDLEFVAFWNTPQQLYGLLEACISELLSENLIDPDTNIVLGGSDQTIKASNTRNLDHHDTRIDPEKERELQLRKNLHLMKPRAKKAAMKKLGLIGGGHKSKWQSAAEKAELVTPGQKWWAPTSESKKG